MKNSSSLNLRMWELFPLLNNKIMVPVMHPWLKWKPGGIKSLEMRIDFHNMDNT